MTCLAQPPCVKLAKHSAGEGPPPPLWDGFVYNSSSGWETDSKRDAAYESARAEEGRRGGVPAREGGKIWNDRWQKAAVYYTGTSDPNGDVALGVLDHHAQNPKTPTPTVL